MTEFEWLNGNNIQKMTCFVEDDRKRQLFAVACLSEVGEIFKSRVFLKTYKQFFGTQKQFIEMAEKRADNLVSKEELQKMVDRVSEYTEVVAAYDEIFEKYLSSIKECDLLRNIVNPFHKFTFKPSEQARNLANAIYWNKDWQALTILADFLEDEGCEDMALLNHLRTKEQVYRGWWSLDLIRGVY